MGSRVKNSGRSRKRTEDEVVKCHEGGGVEALVSAHGGRGGHTAVWG